MKPTACQSTPTAAGEAARHRHRVTADRLGPDAAERTESSILRRNLRLLLNHVGADLADQCVLVTGAATAADCTDQLAAFDQGEAARRGDQRGVER